MGMQIKHLSPSPLPHRLGSREVPEHKGSAEHPLDGPAGKRLVRERVVKWEFVLLLQTLPIHAELLLGACLEEGGGISTSGCFDVNGMFVIFLGNLVNTSILYTHTHIYIYACIHISIYLCIPLLWRGRAGRPWGNHSPGRY